MKKTRNWVSAMKSCCIPPPRKKSNTVSDNRGKKEKKGVGKLTQIKSNSFLPTFKEPSSVEKIFSDFEKERGNVESRTPILPEEEEIVLPSVLPLISASPAITSPDASPKISSPKTASPSVSQPQMIPPQHEDISDRTEPTQINYHASATKIQAIYRGHMARRSLRALKGLVRLQEVVSGQNVKRQTVNAMKQMQRVARVQSQIQSWRVLVLENQSQNQDQHKNDKEIQSSFSRWSQGSEAGDHKNWDDSSVTKNERDARMQRKAQAIARRERTMSYAYSRGSMKVAPKSTQEIGNNYRSAGDLRWCNWLERQLSSQNPKNFSPQKSETITQKSETITPKSLRSTAGKPEQAPLSLRSSPAKSFSNMSGFSRQRPRGDESLFDDADSLMSCPQFTGPHYMSPTISFKAKERALIYPRERFAGTPKSECNRRLSYPFTPVSRFSKASNTQNKISDDNQSVRSLDNTSIASLVSLPARVERRPFNRFV